MSETYWPADARRLEYMLRWYLQGYSVRAIGHVFGIGPDTVNYHLRKHGLLQPGPKTEKNQARLEAAKAKAREWHGAPPMMVPRKVREFLDNGDVWTPERQFHELRMEAAERSA